MKTETPPVAAVRTEPLSHAKTAPEAPEAPPDPLSASPFYRLRRDTLMIVSNLNRGRSLPAMEAVRRQMVFVQSHLCAAALADPAFPEHLRTVLVEFHAATVRDHLFDKRGAKRRRLHLPEV